VVLHQKPTRSPRSRDRNSMLPTVHGFDEYFGYLYHLNAMEDPFWNTYPPEWITTVGPRNLVHSYATDVDDPTEQPRWGKIGKQKIIDEGPLPPGPMPGIKYNMTTRCPPTPLKKLEFDFFREKSISPRLWAWPSDQCRRWYSVQR
jgi:hypothetical protein